MIAVNEIVVDNIRRSSTTVRCTLSWHRLIDGDEYRGSGEVRVDRATEQVDLLDLRAAVDALPVAADDRSQLRDDLITAARTALTSREPAGQTFRGLTIDE